MFWFLDFDHKFLDFDQTFFENYGVCYHDRPQGEIMGGEKYGGINPNPQIFPGDFCFSKMFLNLKRIYSFLSVPDVFASTMINDDI